MRAVLPQATEQPEIELPAALASEPRAEDAFRELLRSRLEILGPVTEADLARPFDPVPSEPQVASRKP